VPGLIRFTMGSVANRLPSLHFIPERDIPALPAGNRACAIGTATDPANRPESPDFKPVGANLARPDNIKK